MKSDILNKQKKKFVFVAECMSAITMGFTTEFTNTFYACLTVFELYFLNLFAVLLYYLLLP